MRNRGFTLIEFIIILTVMAILLAIAIPQFVLFHEEAELAIEKQNAGSVRVGINHYYIESVLRGRSPLYPSILDSAANSFASPQNPFFTYVLAPPGVTRGGWRKINNTLYQGYSGKYYTYDPDSGNFR